LSKAIMNASTEQVNVMQRIIHIRNLPVKLMYFVLLSKRKKTIELVTLRYLKFCITHVVTSGTQTSVLHK